MFKRNRRIYFVVLLILTLFAGLQSSKAVDYLKIKKATVQKTVAVSGLWGESNDYTACKSDSCQVLLKEYNQLYSQLDKENAEISKMFDQIQNPQFISLKQSIEKNQTALDRELSRPDPDNDKVNRIQEELSTQVNDLIMLSTQVDPAVAAKRTSIDKKIDQFDALESNLKQEFAKYKLSLIKNKKSQAVESDCTEEPDLEN